MHGVLPCFSKTFSRIIHSITKELLSKKDEKYREFHKKLVPDTKYEIIGVRIPEIRKTVKNTLSQEETYAFLQSDHRYYEEYMAHGLIIAEKIKEPDETYDLLNNFLPTIDNWAICDTVAASIKKLAKNKDLLLKNIKIWIKSNRVYTVRFAVVCLLAYFTDKEYTDNTIKIVSTVKTDEYYINMAIAWLYSVILVKNYDGIIGLLESKTLPQFIQNKTIDKARDSYRINETKKEYLKTLKI